MSVTVTPADVKKLRDKTDAGMLDCKKALIEANGDFAEAEKILKKKGLASADKRSDRATNQGTNFIKITDSKAVIAELTCETDFVAKTDQFKDTGEKIVSTIIEKGYTEINDELETMVKEAIGILKENMILKRFKTIDLSESDAVASYSHNNGSIGVIVKLACDSAATAKNEAVQALAADICLHVAAFNPSYQDRNSVDPDYIKEQEDIFTDQAKQLGKPENVTAGIVKGKMNKHLAQICLVDQGFVKEDKTSVAKVVERTAKEVGGSIKIAEYIYFMVGQE